MTPENLFTLANIVYLFGTLLLLKRAIQDKSNLHNFDTTGSILTAIATTIILFAYFTLHMYIALIFVIPTWLFWAFVSIYTTKSRIHIKTHF